MLSPEELERIRQSIRENWEKTINWPQIFPNSTAYNCQMYAYKCTAATEHCVSFGTNFCKVESDTSDGKLYFSCIGAFSQKMDYSTVQGLMDAWKSDLSILGLAAEDCSFDDEVAPPSRKIGFYYAVDPSGKVRFGDSFHFIVHENGYIWSHKSGWGSMALPLSLYFSPNFPKVSLIGYFRLHLKQDCS